MEYNMAKDSSASDVLMSVVKNKEMKANVAKIGVKEEEDLPKDERSIVIPKKYLKNCKEGDVIKLNVILDDGDNITLLPREVSEEDEMEEIKVEREPSKKNLKEILSEELDKNYQE